MVAGLGLTLGLLAFLFPRHPPETPGHGSGPLPRGEAAALPRAWPTPFSVPLDTLPPREELPPGTLRVLVLGDSVATFFGLALRYRHDEAAAFVASRGVGECSLFAVGTRPLPGAAPIQTSCASRWSEDVAALRPDVTLIVLGGAFFGAATCDPEWLRAYGERLGALSDGMGEAAGRIVLTLVPYPLGDWRHGRVLAQVDCLNGLFVETARTRRFALLDLQQRLCPTPECVRESRGFPVRPDGLHFDGVGAEDTARWALGEIRGVASSP
jgi:hypothetical protein